MIRKKNIKRKPRSAGVKSRPSGSLAWYKKPVSARIFWPLCILLSLLFLLSLYNIFSLYRLRQEMQSSLEEIKGGLGLPQAQARSLSDQTYAGSIVSEESGFVLINGQTVSAKEAASVSQSAPAALSENPFAGVMSSFGDNFSGLAYIDQDKTDLYWDENVTSFSLPPKYRLEDKGACSVEDCGLSKSDIDPDLICRDAGCLRKDGKEKLYFNNKELLLPVELREEDIKAVTIFSPGDDWLIGLVSGPDSGERGWIYRFDGLAFSPLITAVSEHRIEPRFRRGGGKIYFGGSSEDFIALYAGYDGIAYRFRGQNIEDISRFFGLRVTDGGFSAQIFKIGLGADSDFYICGLNEGKPKVIKIWSKDDLNSGGALDFMPLLSKDGLSAERILCALNDEPARKLAIAAKRGGSYKLFIAQDLGFDISRARQVSSLNLNNKGNEQVGAAVLAEVGTEFKDGSGNGGISFYLANAADRFEFVTPYLWHGFSLSGKELYWRLIMEPGQSDRYSPWLDHINRLDYLFPS